MPGMLWRPVVGNIVRRIAPLRLQNPVVCEA